MLPSAKLAAAARCPSNSTLNLGHPLQWAYTDTYSTYTSVAWRIRTSIGSTLVASGSIPRADPITAAVSSPLSGTIDLKYTTGASSGQPLQGRFTLQVCMANAQVPCDASKDERWSDPSAVFAAGENSHHALQPALQWAVMPHRGLHLDLSACWRGCTKPAV